KGRQGGGTVRPEGTRVLPRHAPEDRRGDRALRGGGLGGSRHPALRRREEGVRRDPEEAGRSPSGGTLARAERGAGRARQGGLRPVDRKPRESPWTPSLAGLVCLTAAGAPRGPRGSG